ncbi:PadR family transcriptional regulator [Nitratireductor rhodophyticola]|uniref:PadR family transcriptional regulator n=1 Tax=Nitratireductor rhodophyticola TaxID=2854036 RepID=UPI002AC8E150|nr:PadR family transcriptional regulator [Nitratireductor rhodophyticola]MEC9247129.1 PadR family transcriptional regulator [Pseudomonadota bacterium]WPZ14215.1 PadR family transcriptional regulator [Nitratireductor rhodophyticola]
MTVNLTDAELLLLGLVAEMPRHGYELEQIIDSRGMREWTQVGFSSIYFVLGKLEKSGLVAAEVPRGAKARKTFCITPSGREVLCEQTIAALGAYRPTFSSLLLGMVHWTVLSRDEALGALETRLSSVDAELERLERVRRQRQPMPDHVESLFDFSTGQLNAERSWIITTLDYMRNKPW